MAGSTAVAAVSVYHKLGFTYFSSIFEVSIEVLLTMFKEGAGYCFFGLKARMTPSRHCSLHIEVLLVILKCCMLNTVGTFSKKLYVLYFNMFHK
jgi:hypothetical protein